MKGCVVLLTVASAFVAHQRARSGPQRTALAPTEDDAEDLLDRARALREEAASLASELPVPPPVVSAAAPKVTCVPALPASTWRFSCSLEGRKAFSFVARLLEETDPRFAEEDRARGRESVGARGQTAVASPSVPNKR